MQHFRQSRLCIGRLQKLRELDKAPSCTIELSYFNPRISTISLEALVSLQEQMTRARDGRVLALGPVGCHGDNDDDGGGNRSILDAVSVDDHPQRRHRLQAGLFASAVAFHSSSFRPCSPDVT